MNKNIIIVDPYDKEKYKSYGDNLSINEMAFVEYNKNKEYFKKLDLLRQSQNNHNQK